MMPAAGMRRVTPSGATLEVGVRGPGEPAVLIQAALIADEFEPVASEPALRQAGPVAAR
jgi:hypothetical protein